MRTKDSDLILEEAFQISLKEGLKKALETTGVSPSTFRYYSFRRKKELGIRSRRYVIRIPKYSTQDKIACIKMAVALVNSGYGKIEKALQMACKKYGLNFHVMRVYYFHGALFSSDEEAQHPLIARAFPGKSIHTASPQSQSFAEQCRAIESLRPAAKISKRREYSGPGSPKKA